MIGRTEKPSPAGARAAEETDRTTSGCGGRASTLTSSNAERGAGFTDKIRFCQPDFVCKTSAPFGKELVTGLQIPPQPEVVRSVSSAARAPAGDGFS